MEPLIALLDARIWLPTGLPDKFARELLRQFRHDNPDFWKKKRMGFSTFGSKPHIETAGWDVRRGDEEAGPRVSLPRGGTNRLREVAKAHGFDVKWRDLRTEHVVKFPRFVVDPDDDTKMLRDYQEQVIEKSIAREQGIVRAPTGSGKTAALLALIYRLGQRSIVIMRDSNLLKQWLRAAVRCLGLDPSEIGQLYGGKPFVSGKRLTLALQQTLHSRRKDLDEMLEREPHGAVFIDEAQTLGARTYQETINHFPCRYRIGFSADETRKDKKEFLTYDTMGEVIETIERSAVEAVGAIHPVTVRVVQTKFRADWYRDAEPAARDHQALIDSMTMDEDRNRLLLDLVARIVEAQETPLLVFTHRRDHVTELAKRITAGTGYRCGELLGGKGSSKQYQATIGQLLARTLQVAVGTFSAVGTGIDLPVVQSGLCATPISALNRQFFGQVRGRICRTSQGKTEALLYYLFDEEVFGREYIRKIKKWNEGNIEAQRGQGWIAL